MKVLLLGAPRPLHLNRWKDDIAEAGEHLGWDVTHLPARGPAADDVVRQAKGADVLLWARTHGHVPHGDVQALLRRIEDTGTVTVGLHLDLYWGIAHRQRQIGVDPWWSCQHVFTADGGPRDWADRGVNHHWCPPAMGLRFYGRTRPSGRYPPRVVFTGAYVGSAHGPHRRLLLRWAKQRWRAGFRQYHGTRQAWGAELSDLYASSRTVLGDSAPAACYWSDRVPTTLGRGGVLAHPHTDGLAEWGFTDETMILYDRFDFDRLGQRIDDLPDARRRELSDNALTLVGERHLWTHRLLDVQRVVFG